MQPFDKGALVGEPDFAFDADGTRVFDPGARFLNAGWERGGVAECAT